LPNANASVTQLANRTLALFVSGRRVFKQRRAPAIATDDAADLCAYSHPESKDPRVLGIDLKRRIAVISLPYRITGSCMCGEGGQQFAVASW